MLQNEVNRNFCAALWIEPKFFWYLGIRAFSNGISQAESIFTSKIIILPNKRLCLPRFSTQSSQYQNWKANKYSILTVTELVWVLN